MVHSMYTSTSKSFVNTDRCCVCPVGLGEGLFWRGRGGGGGRSLTGWSKESSSLSLRGGFYAQSASEPEAIFRARAYSHNVFSPVMMIT